VRIAFAIGHTAGDTGGKPDGAGTEYTYNRQLGEALTTASDGAAVIFDHPYSQARNGLDMYEELEDCKNAGIDLCIALHHNRIVGTPYALGLSHKRGELGPAYVAAVRAAMIPHLAGLGVGAFFTYELPHDAWQYRAWVQDGALWGLDCVILELAAMCKKHARYFEPAAITETGRLLWAATAAFAAKHGVQNVGCK
jgi:hypothetical protein